MSEPLVSHATRLRGLTRGERDQLRDIAQRARTIHDGGARPAYARLYADILFMLHMIGGELAERQEPPR
jgi:hypothetical protein